MYLGREHDGNGRLCRVVCWLCVAAGGAFGCNRDDQATREASSTAPSTAGSGAKTQAPAALSTLEVDHGELDTPTPVDSPKLAATVIAATVYKLPNVESRKLGYVRLGGIVARDLEPVPGRGCKHEWYRIYPMGFMCTDETTTDVEAPLVRAASRRPDLGRPLPYRYGFVRATAPQYLRIPTQEEQLKSEFKLEEHLTWFRENKAEVQRVVLGSNDVALDARGIPRPGLEHAEGFRPSTVHSNNELFGGEGPDDAPPFWLENGRQIPNVSGFEVPEYAVFADRVRRKTGLSFVGAFDTPFGEGTRRFAITVDLRLIPTTKVKPDSGSPFHGLEIPEGLHQPFAWVNRSDVATFKLLKDKDEARAAEAVPKRALVPLSGKARIKAGKRYYQTLKDKTRWLSETDLGIVAPPPNWPKAAEKGEKWIDISVSQQTLVLYEGRRPWYATLVSSGRDRFGDPKESYATPLGEFRLQSKHIAAAMDSDENSAVSGGRRTRVQRWDAEAHATVERLKKLKEAGKALNAEDQRRWDNVEKGRHPEYGVTLRRGSSAFELRDVPWIQYFAAGYALHGAYWHDVFGIPRSHGCVNLSPVDARIVFDWTDPPVPGGWHGINVGSDMGEGTTVLVRK
ncbi:MAG TPA: L,D-transpeptidase [Polyangiaceae bacterium]